MKNAHILEIISMILLVIGGLNWGLFGLFGYDVVGGIFGGVISRIVYIVVGLAAVYQIVAWIRSRR